MMNKCRNPECGKEILEGKNYCNEDCLRKHQAIKEAQKQEQKTSSKTQVINIDGANVFMLRSGSSARSYNIQAVMSLLEKGCTPEQITSTLDLYFKKETIIEYIKIANNHLK